MRDTEVVIHLESSIIGFPSISSQMTSQNGIVFEFFWVFLFVGCWGFFCCCYLFWGGFKVYHNKKAKNLYSVKVNLMQDSVYTKINFFFPLPPPTHLPSTPPQEKHPKKKPHIPRHLPSVTSSTCVNVSISSGSTGEARGTRDLPIFTDLQTTNWYLKLH